MMISFVFFFACPATRHGTMKSSPDLVCKLILVGNGSVGKSSITQNFVEDKFQRVYKQVMTSLSVDVIEC